MTSSTPIPAPPRTPSPLSDDDEFDIASNALPPSARRISFSPNIFPSMSTPSDTTNSTLSPLSAETPRDGEVFKNPFNYQTTLYAPDRLTPGKSNVGQRKGHKYKHSSVSHQIFLEPTLRAPLRLPASLPVPTWREGWKSMSKEQRTRLWWCFCHLGVAGYIQWNAEESQTVTALSHLTLYDAIGAFLCTGIEVISNFEVWKRSTIRQPFGLERIEVLVGFAMSILLLFMGFDLLSHIISHSLENIGDHEPHHAHDHEEISSGQPPLLSLLVIATTLLSAFLLQNHARIAKAMRVASISFLPSILSNPSHLLTLSCSGILLLMPILNDDVYPFADAVVSTTMALLMCVLGFQLVKTLGAILLMSYSGEGNVADVLHDIESDPSVTAIEEAKFWQVHYGLRMANLKLRVQGTEESVLRLREKVASIIRSRLGAGNSSDVQPWEVSTQLMIERD